MMSEKAVRRKKKKDEPEEGKKPTDEETAIAKYIRFNLATKSCNFMGNKVEYFTGSKAVDYLMDSKWASGARKTPIIFTNRESVTRYLNGLLQKGFYLRAMKVAVKKKDKEKDVKESEGKKKPKKSEKSEKESSTQEGGEKKDKEEKEDKKEKDKAKSEESGDKKQKGGKRKIKLEGTNEQIFVDGNDAYVWIFDPIKPLHYVYGLGLVIGAIAVCLFPLWPPWMRIGTYYLSVGGACLVGSIVVLAVVRTIVYGIVWGATLGKVTWWLFPNLLADVGILESFQPIYSVEYSSQEGKSEEIKDKEKDEANQESDDDEKGNDINQETTIENVGVVLEEDSENKKQMSEDEDGPSEDVPESIKTESGQEEEEEDEDEESNKEDENISQEDESISQEDENISQTSEKSESSSSQGPKDFEMVQKEDIVEAEDIEP